MSQPAKVRIGFVGTGKMGQCAHLKNYAALRDLCEVVALAELRPQVRQAVAARYGIPRTYESHQEMLAAEQLDGIVASQPFQRHGSLLPELLAAGIPLFTEKPLASSLGMGEKILQAVQASGTFHMLGYHKRSDPATIAAKAEIERLLTTKELGDLTYIRLLMPAGDWTANGFHDLIHINEPVPAPPKDPGDADLDAQAQADYIEFVNYYIHQVNLLRYLLAEPYQVTYADPAGRLLVGQSASGRPCTIEMSPYRTSVAWQESALICFECGWVDLELPAPLASNRPGRVRFYRDPGKGATPELVEPQLPWVHAMRQQAIHFIRAIRGDMKPLCEAAEALDDLRLARQYLKLWKGV